MKNLFLTLIKLYQRTLSPDHGWFRHVNSHGYCRFHPTCSQYAVDSIDKRGVIIGSIKSIWRIVRCNPWNAGGFDPAK